MLKKLPIMLFVLILMVNGVFALSAVRTFSDNSISPLESITVSISVDGTGASVYGVEENVPSGWTITNVNENGELVGDKISWLFLDSNDRGLTYTATAPSSEGTYGFNGEYTDGDNLNIVSGQTSVVVSSGEPPVEPPVTQDDLMVNYLRGRITTEGTSMPEGTEYEVEVLSGENAGYTYSGTVDENIFNSLRGNGYFDTGDQIGFSTGDEFRISIEGSSCSTEGTFANGGNGDFNTEIGLVSIDCSDNDPPQISPISDIEIIEDSGFTGGFELSASDSDGHITEYEIANENLNKVDCSISDSMLGVRPATDFYGEANCVIRVYDNDNAYAETTVRIIVTNVNDAPIIASHLPGFSPAILGAGSHSFSIEWEDSDNTNAEVLVEWYVDSIEEGLGDSYDFTAVDLGTYEVKVVVSDLEYSTEYVWEVIITDKPVTITFDGDTTDFSEMTEGDLESVNLILEKTGIGKIEFLEPVDLRGFFDLENYVNLIRWVAGIDTNHLTSLGNKLARITFYNLPYDTMPTIYYDSEFGVSGNTVCPSTICKNIIYENNDLSFETNRFSTFTIGDTLSCSVQSGDVCSSSELCMGDLLVAGDTNNCCAITCSRLSELPPQFLDAPTCTTKENLIELKIKEPDDGEDFDVGETINVELKIENNFEDDVDLDVEVHLYDLTEEESIEDKDDSIDINDNDDETLEFEIEIPKDIEDNEFAIYVFIEDEDGEFCTSGFAEIDIERQDDAIIIKEFEAIPSTIRKGDTVAFNLELENIGTDDQDVYVTLQNQALGLNLESEDFELEEFDEDDRETLYFSFRIPANTEDGEYKITAKAFFSGEEVSKTISIIVGDSTPTAFLILDSTPDSTSDTRTYSLISNEQINLGTPETTETNLRVGEGQTKTVRELPTLQTDSSLRVTDTSPTDSSRPRRDSSDDSYVITIRDGFVNNSLWVLNFVLAIGSIIFIIVLIQWVIRR